MYNQDKYNEYQEFQAMLDQTQRKSVEILDVSFQDNQLKIFDKVQVVPVRKVAIFRIIAFNKCYRLENEIN